MKYSGETTVLEHKHADTYAAKAGISREEWIKQNANQGQDCIQTKTVFEVQWSNCPVEVEAEVRRLWRDCNFGNDDYYFSWSEEDAEFYPIIAEYLKSRGIKKCLIHWWW